jgi:hypothetical protein
MKDGENQVKNCPDVKCDQEYMHQFTDGNQQALASANP